MILALKGNEWLRKNPNKITPGQIIMLPGKPPPTQPINTKTFVLDIKSFQRTPGFDWQGKGANKLLAGGGSGTLSDPSEAIEKGKKTTEDDEFILKAIGQNSTAEKVSNLGTGFMYASAANNLVHGRYQNAAKDVIDIGISKSPAAPYYYLGKGIIWTYTGNPVMSKAWYAFEEENKDMYDEIISLQREDEANGNHDNEGRIDDLEKTIHKNALAQRHILETLSERQKSDK